MLRGMGQYYVTCLKVNVPFELATTTTPNDHHRGLRVINQIEQEATTVLGVYSHADNRAL